MDRREHWEAIYGSRAPTEVSWYSAHLSGSLRLIREVAAKDASVIDVGGGASTLVDDLLGAGFARPTVLDISNAALLHARARLGDAAGQVSWIQGDITSVELPRSAFDVWHDRAVFHFLGTATDRAAYMRVLKASLKPNGHVVIGTFALNGPEKCSGLDVTRYDAEALGRELGAEFSLTANEAPVHVTPSGKAQNFLLCRFARNGGRAGERYAPTMSEAEGGAKSGGAPSGTPSSTTFAGGGSRAAVGAEPAGMGAIHRGVIGERCRSGAPGLLVRPRCDRVEALDGGAHYIGATVP
jgi:SAM-dependent methyltransferase